jgi:hypothetical protein
MVGYFNSLEGEVFLCSGDLAFGQSSSADKFFVLTEEVGEGLTLAGSSVIEVTISGCFVSSSCSPAPKSFLEISF